ncbi:MAG: glycosyltransferase family 4 protein [Hyphomonadaceae bacterium]|nr:glycosyltransferase family 4 protein [Hyphomonadaceae bacterium]
MASPLASALDGARVLYRLLPMSLRLPAGRAMRAVLEPALAARLPKAQTGLRLPANAATLIGLFSAPLGHGTAAHLCALELRAAGVEVSEIDVSASVGAPVETMTANAKSNDGAAVLMMNPDTAVHALSRGAADLVRGRRVIGYWVWELEAPPSHWRVGRGLVHEIWTPSAFSAVAARAAFDVPVSVIPHPAALRPPVTPTPESRAAGRKRIGVGAGDFVAFQSFSLASSLERKNPLAAIRAFRDAFGADPKAHLVIRMSQGDRYPQAREKLRTAVREAGPGVTLIEAAGYDELMALYAACDVYISLHRSEGFGLNLAEAMLAERAVIATGWSGNLDFMDGDSSALIPAKLVPVRDPQRVYSVAGARWAEPDHDATVESLRLLRANPDSRAAMATRGAERARALLGGGAAARALRAP